MLSYWKAPNGPVERVYLQISRDQRIYGQRIAGDRVVWRGEDMPPEEAERSAHACIGRLPSWSDLCRMAGSSRPVERPLPAERKPAGHRPMRSSRRSRDDRMTSVHVDPSKMDTAYGTKDSQKLDVYAAGPMPEASLVRIDPQEPREIASILARIPGLEVDIAPLQAGRYLVEDRVVIDRISTHDLHLGIVDDVRPLIARVSGLGEVDHPALFIVEGGLKSHRRASLEKIDGALTYVSVVHGIPVIETIDVWETVYVIARAIRYACHVQDGALPAPVHRRGGRKDHRVSPSYVLEGIPGVSTVRAHAILERFRTVQNVAQASLDELMEVPHLGPGVAQAIYDAFRV